MYPEELERAEPAVLRQPMLYSDILYEPGKVNSRFFGVLRDHGKICATRCAACERVYVPPRASCNQCFGELDEWVVVGNAGTLESYTVVHEPGMLQPVARPYVLGMIRLDGADTALVHYLGEIDPADVRIGMRVTAVFGEERVGNIWDIHYFRPEGERKG
ncbi:Zn-ribbon domain-containing OB-fold protein [Burkholderia contaminans]|uniref:Zn-ribbon domain-containing OB-fold protein n=1 Tax=Burkholderia contaminans TaxID=488447 RepID=UPI003D67DC90